MTPEEPARRLAARTGELDHVRSLPAHSLKPAMLIRIKQLEIHALEQQEIKRLTSEG